MNYFELLGLSPQYALDLEDLELRYKRVISAVHPDRFATSTSTERLMAVRMASQLNQAYTTLRAPLSRAIYLCEIKGYDIEAETNTAMSMDFMMLQMNWRERLDEAVNTEVLVNLHQEVDDYECTLIQQVIKTLDEQTDYEVGVQLIRQWMFVQKMQLELNIRIEK
ncbi:MAG: Fe-S protein assembly co-chaperone HscB [Alcaligenaceae bacterium]|nr:Fe-S protein assembly co-chaperone HscB [Alcaligenaceae bacterium]